MSLESLIKKYNEKLTWLSSEHKHDWFHVNPYPESGFWEMDEEIIEALIVENNLELEANYYLMVANTHPGPGERYINCLKLLGLTTLLSENDAEKYIQDADKHLSELVKNIGDGGVISEGNVISDDYFNFWRPSSDEIEDLIDQFDINNAEQGFPSRDVESRSNYLKMLGLLIHTNRTEGSLYITILNQFKELDPKSAVEYYVKSVLQWEKIHNESRHNNFGEIDEKYRMFHHVAVEKGVVHEVEEFIEITSNLLTFNLFRYFDGEVIGIPPIDLYVIVNWDSYASVKLPKFFLNTYLANIHRTRAQFEEKLESKRFRSVIVPKMSTSKLNFKELFEVIWKQSFALMLDQIENVKSEELRNYFNSFSRYNLWNFFRYSICNQIFWAIIAPSKSSSPVSSILTFGSDSDNAEVLAMEQFRDARDTFEWSAFIEPLRYVLTDINELEFRSGFEVIHKKYAGAFREWSVFDVFIDLARWSIQIKPVVDDEDTKSLSKFGGYPNLPEEHDWPTFGGCPMSFVAQIDLSEIDMPIGCELPSSGVLFFFYDCTQDWGFDKNAAGSSCIFFVEDYKLIPEKERIVKKKFYAKFERKIIFTERKISFQKKLMLPYVDQAELMEQLQFSWDDFNDSDEDSEEYFGEEEFSYGDLWWDHIDTTYYMLGYPAPVQEADPRNYCYRASDEEISANRDRPYVERQKLEKIYSFNKNPKDWILLLQVDSVYPSDDVNGFLWGDLGRIYFMIHHEDLKNKDFSRVRVALQCY